jgi:UV DNA damage repair endonuclease
VSARIGYCCTYVSPSGDEDAARLLNMRGPTIASLARPGGAETASRLEAVIAENLDTLDRQIAAVEQLPALERLFRIQSNFLIGMSHPALAEAWTPTLRAEVAARLAQAGEAARAGDVRLSMHPAQHAILATVNPAALDNALRDIEEHAEIFAMMEKAEVRERLLALGATPLAGSPDDLRKQLAREVPRWRKVIQEAAIKVE